jgi:hypothetical protein
MFGDMDDLDDDEWLERNEGEQSSREEVKSKLNSKGNLEKLGNFLIVMRLGTVGGRCLRESARAHRPLIHTWDRKLNHRPLPQGVVQARVQTAQYLSQFLVYELCFHPKLTSSHRHVFTGVDDDELDPKLSFALSSRLGCQDMHYVNADASHYASLSLHDDPLLAQWCLSPADSSATSHDRPATESSNEYRKRKKDDDDDTSTDRTFDSGGGGDANSDGNSDNERNSKKRNKRVRVNGKVTIACNFCRCA